MSSAADDFRIILDDNSGVGLSFGTDMFVGAMPDAPDECISIIDTGGQEPDKGPYEKATVQIMIRAGVGEYLVGYNLAKDVQRVLHEYCGKPDSGSFYYTGIWTTGEPFYLGTDAKGRPLFSLNFRYQRR
jgi:hypothetical protein